MRATGNNHRFPGDEESLLADDCALDEANVGDDDEDTLTTVKMENAEDIGDENGDALVVEGLAPHGDREVLTTTGQG